MGLLCPRGHPLESVGGTGAAPSVSLLSLNETKSSNSFFTSEDEDEDNANPFRNLVQNEKKNGI